MCVLIIRTFESLFFVVRMRLREIEGIWYSFMSLCIHIHFSVLHPREPHEGLNAMYMFLFVTPRTGVQKNESNPTSMV